MKTLPWVHVKSLNSTVCSLTPISVSVVFLPDGCVGRPAGSGRHSGSTRPHPPLADTHRSGVEPNKKDYTEEKEKVVAASYGDRISSIPCHAGYFAQERVEE